MAILRFLFVIICSLFLVVLVMNESISSYIEQKYHIVFYPQNDILKEAHAFKVKLEQIKAILSNTPLEEYYQKKEFHENNLSEENTEILYNEDNISLSMEIFPDENIQKDTDFKTDHKIKIDKENEFLFIGDSLMQGVALMLGKDLRELGFKTHDLSKQNTGLSYKSYFNWAKVTNEALDKNPKIKYLVVLLGANDPWDIKKDGNYHRFNSKDWLEIYTDRVKEIIKIAKKHKVKVFWYEVPPVKKEDLNKKIEILNQIYNQEIDQNEEIFINTKLFFSQNNTFSTYIKDENNKSIKLRTDDGIHFTTSGSKEMSKLLLQYIKTKDNNESF